MTSQRFEHRNSRDKFLSSTSHSTTLRKGCDTGDTSSSYLSRVGRYFTFSQISKFLKWHKIQLG